MNEVCLIGRCGGDPEGRVLNSGSELARFSLATSENYQDGAGVWHTKTDWHTITAWNKQAEKVKLTVKKGSWVRVIGKLEYNEWTADDGQKKKFAQIRVIDLSAWEPKNQ